MFKQAKKLRPWLFGFSIVGIVGTVTAFYISRSQVPKINLAKDTVEVQAQDLAVQIKANGAATAVRKINLSPKESGRIVELFVKEGDRVPQGKSIARMDDQQFRAQVNQYRAALLKAKADLSQKQIGERPEAIAEASARVSTAEATVAATQAKLNRANEELKRNQSLAQAGAISKNSIEDFITKQREALFNLNADQARLREQQQTLRRLRNGTRTGDIAQAQAEVAQASAQLQFYQAQLENTLVRAPFPGIITRRFADVGDFVTPNTSASATDGATSTSIAELSSGLEIEAKVPEASIAKIKPGQTVEIFSDSYPEERFTGQVNLIAPRAILENNVTSFRVKVALQTGQEKLKAGMNLKLNFLGDPVRNVLVVPLAAIVTKKGGQAGVWLPDVKTPAKFQPVQLGSASGDRVQILTGLKAGDRIFLSPPPGQVIPGVDGIGD